nr:Uncharacterised protein [Streptococcus thermophilus]
MRPANKLAATIVALAMSTSSISVAQAQEESSEGSPGSSFLMASSSDTSSPSLLIIDGKYAARVGDEYRPAAPASSEGSVLSPAAIVLSAVAAVLLVVVGMAAVFKAMFPAGDITLFEMPDGTIELRPLN